MKFCHFSTIILPKIIIFTTFIKKESTDFFQSMLPSKLFRPMDFTSCFFVYLSISLLYLLYCNAMFISLLYLCTWLRLFFFIFIFPFCNMIFILTFWWTVPLFHFIIYMNLLFVTLLYQPKIICQYFLCNYFIFSDNYFIIYIIVYSFP